MTQLGWRLLHDSRLSIITPEALLIQYAEKYPEVVGLGGGWAGRLAQEGTSGLGCTSTQGFSKLHLFLPRLGHHNQALAPSLSSPPKAEKARGMTSNDGDHGVKAYGESKDPA